MACQTVSRNRGHLPPDEREFNKKLRAARSVVERAFGMLKGRWRLLLKKVEQQTRTVSKTVLAACILNNICIDHGDLCDCSRATAIQMTVTLKTI